jgi:hypothetical protein
MKFSRSPGTAVGHPQGSLPRELVIFLFAAFLLWTISLINLSYPVGPIHLNERLIGLLRWNPQGDLLCCRTNFSVLHTTQFFSKGFSWNYPAPCVLVYRFFYLFQSWGSGAVVAAYFTAVVLPIVLSVSLLQAALYRRGLTRARAIFFVCTAALLSWPICYSLDRGNIEALLWLGLALASVFYFRGQWMAAALLIGFMAAFKIYPVLFFALFICTRRYRELAVGLAVTSLTTISALFYLGPTFAGAAWYTLRGIHFLIKGFATHYDPNALPVDHSAFVLVKLLSANHPQSLAVYLPRYELLAGIMALTIFFAHSRKMPRLNRILLLSVFMVLLPSTSFDYTLQNLYIPWAWLCLLIVSAHRGGKKIPGAMLAMLCFAVLLAPEMFLVFGQRIFAGPLKALTLIALIVISMVFPFADEDLSPVETPAGTT